MAGFFKKLADRFRPSTMEQLQQSAEAKKKQREGRTRDTPHVQQPVPRGQLVRPGVEIHTIQPSTSLLTNESHDVDARGNIVWNRWFPTSNEITTCTAYSDPWQQWHNTGTSACTDTIWRIWTGNSGTITTNQVTIHSNNDVWPGWVDDVDRRQVRRKETAAEQKRRQEEEAKYRAEREAQNARYHEEQRAAENRRKAADDRAMELLASMLNDEQRSDLKNNKHFFVNAPSGRLYRIDYGIAGNVKVIDRQSRKVLERLCMHPDGVPAGDVMLMQKLLIETAEVAFRSHANITLESGGFIPAAPGHLTGDKLAQIIPLRKAA